MKKRVPVGEILKLSREGYTDADIIKYLREEGYTPIQINDAINQAKIKLELARTAGIEPEEEYSDSDYDESEGEEQMTPSIMSQEQPEETYYAPPAQPQPMAAPAVAPTTTEPEEAYPYSYPYAYEAKAASTETMEELAEEIIEEKWRDFSKKAGNISEFKTYIESRLKNLDDRLKRIEKAFDKLQSVVLEKTREHGRDVKSLGSEMQALEGAFGKIIQPLTGSVKELRELSDELRRTKTKTRTIKTKTTRTKKRKK